MGQSFNIIFDDHDIKILLRDLENTRFLRHIKWGSMAMFIIESVQYNMTAGGRPDKFAAKKDGTASTLTKTGHLKSNFKYQIPRQDTLIVYNDTPYAWTHEVGDTTRNILARPYMHLAPREEDIVMNYVLVGLMGPSPDAANFAQPQSPPELNQGFSTLGALKG